MNNPIPRIKQFYAETVEEVRKCSWPNRKELMQHTTLVIAMLVMLTAFISATDIIMERLVLWLFQTPQ